MITIMLNGEVHTLEKEHSLAALIASLNLSGRAIAVAVNRQIVPQTQWQNYLLLALDKVDVVRAIGGG
jgi:sulfur carrier protein